MLNPRLNLWLALSLVGLSILFIFLHANSINAPFERDEGHYAYGAWLLTQGMTPYIDTFEQKPPMIFYPYLLAEMISPDAFWPPRLVAAISLLFTLILLGLTVGREFGKRAGWIVPWAALPMIMFPYLNPFAANTEKFMLLPLAGILAIYTFNREKSDGRAWFWAGVCGAVAILYKQIALLPVFFIFCVWLAEDRQRSPGKFFSALGGAAAAFFLFTGYFLARGALPAFWEQLVEFNRYYALSAGGINLRWMAYYNWKFLAAWPLVFILSAWFLIARPKRWWFYPGLMVLSWLTAFNSPYGHYYIMLMPFWAIVTAVALDSVIDKLAKRTKWAGWGPVLGSALILSMLLPVYKLYTLGQLEMVLRFYGPMNPFIESPIVARQVARLTTPEDYVFIAGTEPEVLYYAKRREPTRFGGMYGLMMEHPKALEYQQEVINDLAKNPPRVIVFVRSVYSWLRQEKSPTLILEYLDKLIKEDYQLAGGCIRRKDIAYWKEPLAKGEEFSCSMLVYLRKKK